MSVYRTIGPLVSHDCRMVACSSETLVRHSHDIPTNVAKFHFHSYDSRETFVRMPHDFLTKIA